MSREVVSLDGRTYLVDVYRRPKPLSRDAVRLIIPAYQPNAEASAILRVCVESIRRHTAPDTYELWVVDNHSPRHYSAWLRDTDGLNVCLSRTQPLPPAERAWYKRLLCRRSQTSWGSYANAVGLELGCRVGAADARYVMTLHMDTLCCHPGWLEYLLGKLDDRTKVAGACLERVRVKDGVVHVLGCLMDWRTVRDLDLAFWPSLPELDVGDAVSVGVKRAGYGVFACRNTYEDRALAAMIAESSPYHALDVVRCFDDNANVIFMHLGRGIRKAAGTYGGKTAGSDQWIAFAREIVLTGNGTTDERTHP